MKKVFHICSVMLTIVVLMSSCLSDKNSDTTVYEDTAITTFTLGTLNRYIQTKSSTTGNDTVIKATITGSSYKMAIDHLNKKIYNTKPLPYGTDVAHVIVSTLTVKNGGTVLIKSMGDEETYTYYNVNDSIDFSQERSFLVRSTDGTSQRTYQVSLNVETALESTNSEWADLGVVSELAGMTGCRLVALADRLYAFGEQSGQTVGYVWTIGNEQACERLSKTFSTEAWKHVVANTEALYLKEGDKICRSTDGISWEETGTAAGVKQLLAAGTQELFALGSDNLLKRSVDKGATWTTEQLDDDAKYLPTEQLAAVTFPYATSDHTDYVLLVGQRAASYGDAYVSIWRKVSEYWTGTPGQWVYMDLSDVYGEFRMTGQQSLSLVSLDRGVLALGSEGQLLLSRDQGITWKKDSYFVLPAGFTAKPYVAMAADRTGRIWLLDGNNHLWSGK
jgi:hypothetical protein